MKHLIIIKSIPNAVDALEVDNIIETLGAHNVTGKTDQFNGTSDALNESIKFIFEAKKIWEEDPNKILFIKSYNPFTGNGERKYYQSLGIKKRNVSQIKFTHNDLLGKIRSTMQKKELSLSKKLASKPKTTRKGLINTLLDLAVKVGIAQKVETPETTL